MGPCIESTRTPSQRYPQVTVPGTRRRVYEHRLAWEEAYGAIPVGMQVNHHCDNGRCIRLDHLYLGTQLDNMRDRLARDRNPNALKTHCPSGHEYTPENTLLYSTRQGRKCRTCHEQRRSA